MSFSKKDVYMQAAKIYVSAFDPTSVAALAIPAVDQTTPNYDTIVAYLELNRTFLRAGYWRDVSITHDVSWEKKVLEVDDCDVGIFANTTTMLPKLEWERVTCDDLDTMSTFTGLAVLDVVSAPVAVTTEVIAAAWAALWEIYIILNKSWDDSIVSSIVVDDDWTPLVLNTDYTVGVDTDGSVTWTIGNSYIVFILATSANSIDVDYSYTPNTAQYLGYDIDPMDIPFVIIKVVGCPDSDWEYNTYYIVKASLDWEIKDTFVNLSRVDDVVGSSISFIGDNGWLFIEKKEKIA